MSNRQKIIATLIELPILLYRIINLRLNAIQYLTMFNLSIQGGSYWNLKSLESSL